MSEDRRTLIKTASYEAEPGEVGRVLLLYSGGLDTSVMLKWIQDEYEVHNIGVNWPHHIFVNKSFKVIGAN